MCGILLLFIIITRSNKFDLYLLSFSPTGSTFSSFQIYSLLMWQKGCTRLFFCKNFRFTSFSPSLYFTGPPTCLTVWISSINLQMFIERIMFWTLVEQKNTSNGPWHTQHHKLTAWCIRIFAMANAGLPFEVRRYPERVVCTGRVIQRPTAARLGLLACPNPIHTHQRLLAVKEHINKRYKTKEFFFLYINVYLQSTHTRLQTIK